MKGLRIRFGKAGAWKHVSRWKKRMDQTIRRAVKASRRAIPGMAAAAPTAMRPPWGTRQRGIVTS